MDTAFLLLLLYLVFNGIYRGFSGFILKSFGLLLGLYLSLPVYKFFSAYLSRIFSGSSFLLDFLSFLAIFLFIISTFLVMEGIIKKRLYRKKVLALTDRILGGVLGFSVFILLIIVLVRLESQNIIVSKLVADSKIVELFKKI